MGQNLTNFEDFQAAAIAHARNASGVTVVSTKGPQSISKFDGRTGEWVRTLHLQAGGCAKTTGDARLVL